ncbi:uncharacterized protein LOC126743663 [Anthonomus grandis grandis]|uniref:uncharacterized protein LOC126743663 n=1 Tax=Anthonomus grandis grandis TaxID=2921223 RepID=UPI00216543CF|nr:uncharacterized protein LOC126743663 [Anthonomus grandis grandis]
MVRYSTALSHIFLAGISIYCWKNVNRDWPFPQVAFGIIAFHSLLGVWKWGNPTYGQKIDRLYGLTTTLQDLLVLPCIVTTLWLKYSYSLNFVISHSTLTLLPLALLLQSHQKFDVIDVFLLGNVLSSFVVSYFNDNQFGVSVTLSYILSYFIIKRDMINSLPMDVPIQDLFNYSMCFFCYFALKAVQQPFYEY